MDATTTPTTTSLTAPRGPVTARERALAPDLARGAMLLLIVLANTPYYLWGLEHGLVSGHPTTGSAADRVVQVVMLVAVDLRTYPMFAFLFGYGIVQLVRRQREAGVAERGVRRLLRRRHWWLLALGLVHAALLWEGDILGIYGLVGLLTCWLFLRRTATTLRVWSGVLLGLMVAGTALVLTYAWSVRDVLTVEDTGGGPDVGNAIANPDYLASVGDRLTTWGILLVLQGLLTLVVPLVVLLAFQAARHRVLEEPGRHLPLLRRVAVGGIAVGWLGGLPGALDQVGVLAVPDGIAWALFPVQATTGLFAGVGYVACFGLLAHRLTSRPAGPGRVAGAMRALGERSLSGYLVQSLVCAPLLAAWGLGLGQHLTSWSMALLAVAVWAATVVAAAWLHARGRRGPAEVLLRRLTYGRAAAAGSRAAGPSGSTASTSPPAPV
jgi:uncharacterized protein